MKNGYLAVGLHCGNKTKMAYVHRLVAIAFVSNMDGLNEVNHIDEDKENNHALNLEWCTHKYNINYGSTRARISKAHIDGGHGKIPVIQKKDGVLIARYDSASDAERATGICSSSIRKCCLKRPKFLTAGGYEWSNV